MFMPVFVLVFTVMGGVFDAGGLVLVDEPVVVPLGHGGCLEMHREVAHSVVFR